jgi:hypothetical protein
MNPVPNTPVPNVLFDLLLKDLKASELKILLIIIRQTLGWVDKKEKGGRKSRDWISTSQLERKTGLSRRAISCGLALLVQRGLIRVTDHRGFPLHEAKERKGKIRLYYELSYINDIPVEKMGKTGLNPLISGQTSAEIADHISKNLQNLAQKMHITKQTL